MLLATILGGLIGFERRVGHKEAGVRTHALVTVGSTLFTAISIHALTGYPGFDAVDISRIMAQVIVGVGFLGAGLIVFTGKRVANLTTAAGIWICAGIGMAVGVGWYIVASAGTVIVLLLLWVIQNYFPSRTVSYSKSKSDDD